MNFRQGKSGLILSILTLITVILWVAVEVYHALSRSTIPKVTQEQLTPLDPRLNREIIDELKENVWFSKEELIPGVSPFQR